jgi:hypothetical protein
LHADEVVGAQQLIELVYELVSRDEAETRRLMRDLIVLVVHANPDGHELVSKWYMREQDPALRTLAGVPRLYQKYIGHDNNRDFYMSTQPETRNLNRVLVEDWLPQIVYDHHQTGPPGTVMFAPPFREPFNYVFDPLIPPSIEQLGAAMHARFAAEGKPGVTSRSGSDYSTWWNGGLRTSAYFHNQIGLLTEIIGGATPVRIPFVDERQIPTADLPLPVAPRTWHLKESIDYSMTANRAVLDTASRNRETLLYNIYRMGRNSIERGSRDSWTPSPHRRAAAGDPASRDPRGYILPADQPDFLTATKFANALRHSGVQVERATAEFSVAGKRYPAGSLVVRTAQAFRPHILTMFEPQDHPDDVPAPGAAPIPPYDSAGWTLAYQMGVAFDRILDAFDGPFERLSGLAPLPRGDVTGPANSAGYLVSHRQNDAFVLVNRLLSAGADVVWPRDRSIGGGEGTGSMYIPATPAALPILRTAAADLGLRLTGVAAAPRGAALRLRPVRIAVWDQPGETPESGWIRWLLEQYEFPFERVTGQMFEGPGAGDRFDVLILPGSATPQRHTARLKAFVEGGGTVIAIGGATAVANALGVPVAEAPTERGRDGRRHLIPKERYFVPGSILRARVDNSQPLAFGVPRDVDVYVDNSPAFSIPVAASATTRVAWFASPTPLRSGWAWGQAALNGAVAIVDATVGRGRVLLFGPEIAFRGQSHGTFKFLFNAIYYPHARAEDAR